MSAANSFLSTHLTQDLYSIILLNNPKRLAHTVKCNSSVQRYQSQPIAKQFQKQCKYFLNLKKLCQIFLSRNILQNI